MFGEWAAAVCKGGLRNSVAVKASLGGSTHATICCCGTVKGTGLRLGSHLCLSSKREEHWSGMLGKQDGGELVFE